MEGNELFVNLDWDPVYLESIFKEDFYDFMDMWNCTSVSDEELHSGVEKLEIKLKYSPIVEDISMEDEVLCAAVEQIEKE